MTGNEAISVLLNAYKYEVQKGGRACGKTALRTALLMGANAISLIQKAMGDDDYWTADKIEVLEELLKRESISVADSVSKGLFDQIKWERDIAIEQLEELGLSLGQKIDGVYITKEEYNRLLECVDKRYKYGENLFVNTQFR